MGDVQSAQNTLPKLGQHRSCNQGRCACVSIYHVSNRALSQENMTYDDNMTLYGYMVYGMLFCTGYKRLSSSGAEGLPPGCGTDHEIVLEPKP